jgi:syntaxin 7
VVARQRERERQGKEKERMSFQDLEAGHVRGAPLGGGRRNGRGPAGAAGAGASQAVASGVFQINTAVATFQRLVNTLGTPKDTPDLRDRMCVRRPRLPALPYPQSVSIALP